MYLTKRSVDRNLGVTFGELVLITGTPGAPQRCLALLFRWMPRAKKMFVLCIMRQGIDVSERALLVETRVREEVRCRPLMYVLLVVFGFLRCALFKNAKVTLVFKK